MRCHRIPPSVHRAVGDRLREGGSALCEKPLGMTGGGRSDDRRVQEGLPLWARRPDALPFAAPGGAEDHPEGSLKPVLGRAQCRAGTRRWLASVGAINGHYRFSRCWQRQAGELLHESVVHAYASEDMPWRRGEWRHRHRRRVLRVGRGQPELAGVVWVAGQHLLPAPSAGHRPARWLPAQSEAGTYDAQQARSTRTPPQSRRAMNMYQAESKNLARQSRGARASNGLAGPESQQDSDGGVL